MSEDQNSLPPPEATQSPRLPKKIFNKIRKLIPSRTANLSTEETTTKEPETEYAQGLQLPTDIQTGIQKAIEDLARSVEIGIPMTGLKSSLSSISQGLELAQEAIGEDINLSPEAKQSLQAKMENIVRINLDAGFQSTVSVFKYQVKQGNGNYRETRQKAETILEVAKELGVSISHTPETKEEKDDSETRSFELAPTISSKQELLNLFEGIEREHILTGIKKKIEMCGYDVRIGLLSRVGEKKAKIDELVKRAEELAYEIVDEESATIPERNNQNLPVRRVINRREIEELIEDQIKSNLTQGVESLISGISYKTKNGLSNPMRAFEGETFESYEQEGKRLGLVSEDLDEAVQGNAFNLSKTREKAQEQLKEHFPQAIKKILERHLKNLRKGELNYADFATSSLEEYNLVAEKYDIQFDLDDTLKKLNDQINPENLQTAVQSLLEEIKDQVRGGQFVWSFVWITRTRDLKTFIHERGLSEKVDISKLEEYLKNHGLTDPALQG